MAVPRAAAVPLALVLLSALPGCGKSGSPAEVDADHDGFTVAQGDCDDSNAAVHPGGEVAFAVDFAFSGAAACSARNPAQQVYRVTNDSCAAVTLQGLQVTLALGGTCSGGDAYSVPLEVAQVAPGATTIIRRGAPAGSVAALCCQSFPCPPGACTVGLQYALATSAGTRTLTQSYTVNDPTGRDCPACGTIGTDETMRAGAAGGGQGLCLPPLRPY